MLKSKYESCEILWNSFLARHRKAIEMEWKCCYQSQTIFWWLWFLVSKFSMFGVFQSQEECYGIYVLFNSRAQLNWTTLADCKHWSTTHSKGRLTKQECIDKQYGHTGLIDTGFKASPGNRSIIVKVSRPRIPQTWKNQSEQMELRSLYWELSKEKRVFPSGIDKQRGHMFIYC